MHSFGAVFTQETNTPISARLQWLGAKNSLAFLKEETPVSQAQAINDEAEKRALPQKIGKEDFDTQSVSAAPEKSKHNSEPISGIGFPMQLNAGGLGGAHGQIGPVGEANGRVMEDAQWAARQRSAYNYFSAFQQSLNMLPEPKTATECLVYGDGYDCNEANSGFGNLFASRLGFLYRLYPSFPAIQMRYEVGGGWIAELTTKQ